MGCLQRAFEERFDDFKRGMTMNSMQMKGNYVSDNEFPIG
jgi:hypothetical protein